MPKPYKTRKFNYYFSEENETQRYNFKKEFTIFLDYLIKKEKSIIKRWFSIADTIILVGIISVILTLIVIFIILK